MLRLFVVLKHYVLYVLVILLIPKLEVMSVIVLPNKNIIELYEKVVLDGASTKDSCSAAETQNETPVSREDPIKILIWLIMDVKDDMFVQSEHYPNIELLS